MRTQRLSWSSPTGWHSEGSADVNPSVVIYFGDRGALVSGERYTELRQRFPGAHIIGCSTGGQIETDDVTDESVVAVALGFESTRVQLARATINEAGQSRAIGETIGRALKSDDLAGVFLVSDGLNVNGSALTEGLATVIGSKIPVCGGLAGDGSRFEETLVGADAAPAARVVAAIGFYGDHIRIGSGSAGGWDIFGPRRRISRAEGPTLFELDGQPALDLYERYLGEKEALQLPGSALLFPLRIQDPARPDTAVVRTILAVDKAARSMSFAGDMPEGWSAQLMRGSFDRLVAGAADAARQARVALGDASEGPQVAILVSCIGRRLLMGQRIVDETEAVGAKLGPACSRIGFYSYGEISPHSAPGPCEFHNQTMTIMTLAEIRRQPCTAS